MFICKSQLLWSRAPPGRGLIKPAPAGVFDFAYRFETWSNTRLQIQDLSLAFPSSFQTPELEGRPNLTTLDLQLKKLRDSALDTIREGARRMREEAADVRDTLPDIESWAEKLQFLAEEVLGSLGGTSKPVSSYRVLFMPYLVGVASEYQQHEKINP